MLLILLENDLWKKVIRDGCVVGVFPLLGSSLLGSSSTHERHNSAWWERNQTKWKMSLTFRPGCTGLHQGNIQQRKHNSACLLNHRYDWTSMICTISDWTFMNIIMSAKKHYNYSIYYCCVHDYTCILCLWGWTILVFRFMYFPYKAILSVILMLKVVTKWVTLLSRAFWKWKEILT